MDPKVDMSDLAMKMLAWEQAQLLADDLRAEIVDAVLQIKRTQTVGNVRASYSGGHKSYDYQKAGDAHPTVTGTIIRSYTTRPPPCTDWRKICEHVGIEKADVPFTQSLPSVTVKLLA